MVMSDDDTGMDDAEFTDSSVCAGSGGTTESSLTSGMVGCKGYDGSWAISEGSFSSFFCPRVYQRSTHLYRKNSRQVNPTAASSSTTSCVVEKWRCPLDSRPPGVFQEAFHEAFQKRVSLCATSGQAVPCSSCTSSSGMKLVP